MTHEAETLEQILSLLKLAQSTTEEISFFAEKRRYARVRWNEETKEEAAGFMVEYDVVPQGATEDYEESDFFCEEDFDRAAISIYFASQQTRHQNEYEEILDAIKREKDEKIFYVESHNGQRLRIKYDQSIGAWLFQDEKHEYKFENKKEEAAKHIMRFKNKSV